MNVEEKENNELLSYQSMTMECQREIK